MATGDHIEVRHSRKCRAEHGGRCNCAPSYRVRIVDNEGKRIRQSFATEAAAKSYYREAEAARLTGRLRAPTDTTLQGAADAFIRGMEGGKIRNRSGDPYKPSAIRGYERALRLRVLPELGTLPLAEIRRRDVQAFVEAMQDDGLTPSTIRNTLDPLRVIFRRAIRDEELDADPMLHLELPADRGRRDRFAMPDEATKLIEALPDSERALWATAFYTGLRRGELRELRCSDYDRGAGMIRVERALDDAGTVILTKTYAGDRDVPVIPTLKRHLAAHLLRTGRSGDALLFGRTSELPFIPTTVRSHALDAWDVAKLKPITLHEARHSAATMLRAAGIDFKLISAIVGHASVSITQDRYTHIAPEHLRDAGERLDAYLVSAAAGQNAGH